MSNAKEGATYTLCCRYCRFEIMFTFEIVNTYTFRKQI